MARIVLFVVVLTLVACSPSHEPPTLCGEPVVHGAAPIAIVDTVDLPNLPNVFLSKENGKVGIGVFQAGTCEPYLTLRDADDDGVFDLLTYSSLSPDGEVLVEVEDYGMDGQPDFILDVESSSATVFYHGSWYPVSGIGTGNTATVEIEGRSRPLQDILKELGREPF